jgi:pilus assembly protein TadC
MENVIIIIGILIFAAAFFIMQGIMKASGQGNEFIRLQSTTQKKRLNLLEMPLVRNLSNAINAPFVDLPYLKNIQLNTRFLKLPFGALEILFIKEFLMLGGGILGFILRPDDFLWPIIGAVVAFVLPDIILNAKASAKKEAMLRIFPETVDILDLCIGAGLDFLSALRWVVEKSDPNPFVEQLEIVLSEISVGRSRTEALKDMANRVRVPDINSFVRTIVQAERMGISIEEALRNLSEDTRTNRFQRGEQQAIKAGLKMLIPLMLFILPVILIVVAGPVIIQFTQGDLIPNNALVGQ